MLAWKLRSFYSTQGSESAPTVFTSSCSSLLPLHSSSPSIYSSPGWAAFLLHQDKRSIEEATTARTRVGPGRRGGCRGATRRLTRLITVEHLLRKRRRRKSVTCVCVLPVSVCYVCVCVCYLCSCAAWWGGGVVSPGDGQVVAAALPPQTLNVKRRLPTWKTTRMMSQWLTVH